MSKCEVQEQFPLIPVLMGGNLAFWQGEVYFRFLCLIVKKAITSTKFKPELAQFIFETEGLRQVQLHKSTFSLLNLETNLSPVMTSCVLSSTFISARNWQGTLQRTPSSAIQSQCTSRECTHTAVNKNPSSKHEQPLLTEHSNDTLTLSHPLITQEFSHLVNHSACSCSH